MREELDILSEEVLTQLELKETGMLSWGFIGGYLVIDTDIEEIIKNPPTDTIKQLWEKLENQGETVQSVIENLRERKLIFLRSDGLARTRYAETIRLLYQLRQRFSYEDWNTAPSLVSNIRFAPRYRRYPKRNVEWTGLRDNLLNKSICDEFMCRAIDRLLNIGSNKIELSNFQVQSLETIISNSKIRFDRAVIIGAGTGAGKTKAFYLPAISLICDDFRKDDSYYTRAVALYPRNELLKDQYKESLSEVTKLNEFLKSNNLRTIIVGAYYGDVPPEASNIKKDDFYEWKKEGRGYVCPSLLCPKCNSNLLWYEEDLDREIEVNKNNIYGHHEILHCANEKCDFVADKSNVVLTRKRMQETPPDILFTTTEMLNRKLFDTSDQHIFGVNARKTPQFMLLDEVHINEGVLGAHVAFLIRRWRNLVKLGNNQSKVQFVGLSATLTDPKIFFSNLVGLEEMNTMYITPSDDDLVEEGMEYNVVLRGDPMSEKSLLSTSVQTAMLIGRSLDPLQHEVSKGANGSKVFAFTDKLDVINRWFHIEQDAEGKQVLSKYRDPGLITKYNPKSLGLAQKNGQVWDMAHSIDDGSLKRAMKVGITSSQSKGVDQDAKLVIATSTLEVGFNDPYVGAVIQHKAPRNMASFLQRKGRGGRQRGMRPWTLVVTSAYGRDRWAYENYEQLFNPILPPLSIPVNNVYVQHIQASFAIMDWLAYTLSRRGFKNVNISRLLVPSSSINDKAQKNVIYETLMDVLGGNYGSLEKFIKDSLKLDSISLDRVMWMPPRSIMFDLIPSLTAQIDVNWNRVVQNNEAKAGSQDNELYALVGYVPRNLFSNLEVNDIKLVIPDREQNKNENMALKQGMMEFAPGNVSKRYANLKNKKSAHWLPVPMDTDTIDLSQYSNIVSQKVGIVDSEDGPVEIYMPKIFRLEVIPDFINDRTSGFPTWNFEMLPNGQKISPENKGQKLRATEGAYLSQIIDNVEVYSSDNNQGVLCTRYYDSINVQIKANKGQNTSKAVSLNASGKHAALGFKNFVDAICVSYKPIDIKALKKSTNIEEILKELRGKFYISRMKNDVTIGGMMSVFEIEWMCQICLASVIAISISKGTGISEAIDIYKGNLRKISERTMTAVFQTLSLEDKQDDDFEEGKLAKRLLEHVDSKLIMDVFLENLKVLYKNITDEDDFWDWVWEKYVATIAAGFKTAIDELLPDTNTEDLIIDIDSRENVIWISEPDSGGIGIITNVANMINKYPSRFEEYFVNSVRFCKQHEISNSLDRIVENIHAPMIKDSFEIVRDSKTLEKQKEALESVQSNLYKLGIPPTNELIVMVISKLLNTNSSNATDDLAFNISKTWKEEENRLNCSIGIRTFSVACIQVDDVKDEIDDVLHKVVPGTPINEKQRFALVESLLWNDCKDSCPDCLQIYNSFSKIAEPSRIIMGDILGFKNEYIKYGSKGWKKKVTDLLLEGKTARVFGDSENLEKMRSEMMEFVLTPIDARYELFYPAIRGASISNGQYTVDLFLREESDE